MGDQHRPELRRESFASAFQDERPRAGQHDLRCFFQCQGLKPFGEPEPVVHAMAGVDVRDLEVIRRVVEIFKVPYRHFAQRREGGSPVLGFRIKLLQRALDRVQYFRQRHQRDRTRAEDPQDRAQLRIAARQEQHGTVVVERPARVEVAVFLDVGRERLHRRCLLIAHPHRPQRLPLQALAELEGAKPARMGQTKRPVQQDHQLLRASGRLRWRQARQVRGGYEPHGRPVILVVRVNADVDRVQVVREAVDPALVALDAETPFGVVGREAAALGLVGREGRRFGHGGGVIEKVDASRMLAQRPG